MVEHSMHTKKITLILVITHFAQFCLVAFWWTVEVSIVAEVVFDNVEFVHNLEVVHKITAAPLYIHAKATTVTIKEMFLPLKHAFTS